VPSEADLYSAMYREVERGRKVWRSGKKWGKVSKNPCTLRNPREERYNGELEAIP
jgi:hypothetical protein